MRSSQQRGQMLRLASASRASFEAGHSVPRRRRSAALACTQTDRCLSESTAAAALRILVRPTLPRTVGSQKYTWTPDAIVNGACAAISLPRSHVNDRRRCAGSFRTAWSSASFTASAFRPCGNGISKTSRVWRSTSGAIADCSRRPRIKSPSQWPGTARSATSAGRSLISTMFLIWPERLRRPAGRRCVRPVRRNRVSSRRSAPRLCTKSD